MVLSLLFMVIAAVKSSGCLSLPKPFQGDRISKCKQSEQLKDVKKATALLKGIDCTSILGLQMVLVGFDLQLGVITKIS